MKMHVLSGGRLRMKKSIYLPDAQRGESIELPVSCYLLRHAQGNVLFDTGCHPSVSTDAEARWGGMARFMEPIGSTEDNLISQLALLGLTPLDIDVVVNSHLHTDHCGCNAYFTRATIIVHARELEAANAEDAVQNAILPIDWKHPMTIETIDAERDLFGDARIVLLPLPGHTLGTTAALVSLARSGRFLLASDAVALQANLEREIHPRNNRDPYLWLRSLCEIRRIRDAGATVIYGHDLAQWNSLQKGADAYL